MENDNYDAIYYLGYTYKCKGDKKQAKYIKY